MESITIDPILLDTLTWLFVIPGGILLIIGAVGMITLPDVFARMHAAGIIDTLGMELILVGLMFQSGLSLITVKLALILVFVFFTSPTATHALAHSCLNGGLRPHVDDENSVTIGQGSSAQGGGSSKT